ncbi:unnamed protein product [Nippostrongylus brasiliensis]|uniref:Dynactin subunit 3 (inferred by orthology to a human protein) n=1 Tax=Nippostrongylus brasiliensis TaxID=27835 RepID=A0A158R345_NIPBR|nr:unnamed protein product [Nippostrongylus brasiliensis]
MQESLEDRVAAIEKVLGIDEATDAKPSDFDVVGLQKRMSSLGLDRVMKIPLVKLKNLKNLSSKPYSQPLSERLTHIVFCENLIRQRVDLLKEFEERLQTDKVALVSQQEKQLSDIAQDVQTSLERWKEYTMDLEKFKTEYFAVVSALRERIDEMEKAVALAEC